MKQATFWIAAGLTLALAAPVWARSKLVALPDREETWVRLDNPTATLVQEERTLTLQAGLNRVDFSWRGVRIDADSIRMEMLSHPKEVKLLNVSYPPGEAALVWQIHSPNAYQEKVRISYLLSGIDRLVTYKAVAEKDESKLGLKSYLVLRNFSGEPFSKAKVLLDYGESFMTGILHEETKRMLFFQAANLPIEKVFRWDSRSMPWDPEKARETVGIPFYYLMANTQEKGLGKAALWGGKGRVFQKDGHGSTIFLGEDYAKFTPVGEKLELRIGQSRDISVTQKKMQDKRIKLRKNDRGRVVLYDTDEIMEVKIENFKDGPAILELTEQIPGQWDMIECSHEYEKENAYTLKFTFNLKPKEKVKLVMHYNRRNVR
ncbi:MAG: hypothetical protein ACYTHN_24660 [Planctomycetota bacterium]|jgi:hypothetical protein